jgi:4-amino-4-deoxy-L-arabinose transferase-like glycosyltransferase
MINTLALALVTAATICFWLRARALGWVLFFAFLLRLGAVGFHTYIGPLPDSGADALNFQHSAEGWAQFGFLRAFHEFPGVSSYLYSWFLALLYSIDGPSPLAAQMVNVILGLFIVYLAYRLGGELWGPVIALRGAWVVALFPAMVLYSAITMREAVIVAFFMAGLVFCVRWRKRGSSTELIKAVGCFAVAGGFHSAMFLAIGALLAAILLEGINLRNGLSREILGRLLAILLGIAAVAGLVVFEISLPKIGTLTEAVSEESLTARTESATRGGARYPDWLLPKNGVSAVSLLPPRIVYLLCAPFPWDIRSPNQLVGLADGAVYAGLLFLIWTQRKRIAASREAMMVLLLTLLMVSIFALGASNFGTGLRHRAKFFAVFAVLAAPALPRFYTGK